MTLVSPYPHLDGRRKKTVRVLPMTASRKDRAVFNYFIGVGLGRTLIALISGLIFMIIAQVGPIDTNVVTVLSTLAIIPVFATLVGIAPTIVKGRTTDSHTIVSATKQYEAMLPHNKAIAQPLVEKLCGLVGEDTSNHKYTVAIRDRVSLLNDISAKDKRDRDSQITIDNSDIDAVQSMLAGHKELGSS